MASSLAPPARAQVMTDKIAARILATLHTVDLLPPVWAPPPEVRDHRALVAQRTKMMCLSISGRVVAKSRRERPPEGTQMRPGARTPRFRTGGVLAPPSGADILTGPCVRLILGPLCTKRCRFWEKEAPK